jgi:hypothetical protein
VGATRVEPLKQLLETSYIQLTLRIHRRNDGREHSIQIAHMYFTTNFQNSTIPFDLNRLIGAQRRGAIEMLYTNWKE